jgi:hypothetical protein
MELPCCATGGIIAANLVPFVEPDADFPVVGATFGIRTGRRQIAHGCERVIGLGGKPLTRTEVQAVKSSRQPRLHSAQPPDAVNLAMPNRVPHDLDDG